MTATNELNRKIGNKRLFYIARDVERATAGLLLAIPNFYIITNDSPYARELAKKNKRVVIVKSKKILDTWEMLTLKHKGIKALKQIKKGDFVMVFKNTEQIERICKENNWTLLNPSADLSKIVEEKISQVKWLGPLTKYLPPHRVDVLKNIVWKKNPFILQFNRAHTGTGTFLVKNKKQLDELKQKFPNREARVTKFIAGTMFTNNNVVWGNKILLGNINYQITGEKPFTDNLFATVGNNWKKASLILTPGQIKQYQKIATDIGKRLAKNGWKGLFGIDVMLEEKTKKMYLIEINARQPASTTFESELQRENMRHETWNKTQKTPITTFEAHLRALLGVKPNEYELIKIKDGGQVIKRVGTGTSPSAKKLFKKLEKHAWRVIKYNNSKPGEDEIRYQFLTNKNDGFTQ